MVDEEMFEETDEPGVLKARVTSDPGKLLYPTLHAQWMMKDLVDLVEVSSVAARSMERTTSANRTVTCSYSVVCVAVTVTSSSNGLRAVARANRESAVVHY